MSNTYSSVEEIRDAVIEANDALTMRMGEIRDAHGAGRLGIHVREGISKKLRSLGLAHYPRELPGDQNSVVRIYRQGTPMADLIDAVLNPSETHDEELRQTIGGSAEEILEQIRELVCG